jgi:hypothetical protein
MTEPVKGDGGNARCGPSAVPPVFCVAGQSLLSYPGKLAGVERVDRLLLTGRWWWLVGLLPCCCG